MRSVIFAVVACGISGMGTAVIADEQGPGSINWPPPGGDYNTRPVFPQYQPVDDYVFRSGNRYQPRPRYQPSFHSAPRAEWISPPGEDWPNAEYAVPESGAHDASATAAKSATVEVVPPPNIPVEAVEEGLSKQPKRGWRPMDAHPRQLKEPAQVPSVKTPDSSLQQKHQPVDVMPIPTVREMEQAEPETTAVEKPEQAAKIISGMPLPKPGSTTQGAEPQGK